jgi:protein SCO1/2
MMTFKPYLVPFFSLLLLLLPVSGRGAPAQNETINIKLYDLEMLNQDGKRLRFKSDVIGDKLVIISFTYSTCTLRPVIDGITIGVQEKLGQRLGRDVEIVSISIDPATDIPPRMKQYQKSVNARPGWVFLTGKKADVDRVLVGLDSYAPNIASHPLSLLVGDGRTGKWKRIFGFPSPEAVMKVLQEFDAVRR